MILLARKKKLYKSSIDPSFHKRSSGCPGRRPDWLVPCHPRACQKIFSEDLS